MDTVFVHTNHRQLTGALVSAYSLRRNSRQPDKFEVKIIGHEDYPFFAAREGQSFLRGKEKRVWLNDDLQSFTPLRFMPPELMGYQGRAVIIDPDVFAVGDVWELLSRDMDGKAVMCRARPGHNQSNRYLATSVMLLDCAKLGHWHCQTQFNQMFDFKLDYVDWIELGQEPRETIGLLEEGWNHFDTLNQETKLLHNTKRKTQPWKTGLPVDYTVRDKRWGFISKRWLRSAKNRLLGDYPEGRYLSHPDPRQEQFFFGLLRECLDKGIVSEDLLRQEMAKNHIRHDALELLDRTPKLAA